MGLVVELGVPYTGWPVRLGSDYEFGLSDGRISAGLREQILDWARLFNENYSDDGWASENARDRHRQLGVLLQPQVAHELGAEYSVRLIPTP